MTGNSSLDLFEKSSYSHLNVIFLSFVVETRNRVGIELVRLIQQFQEHDISIFQEGLDNGVPFSQISEALCKYGYVTKSNIDDALLSAFMLLLKSKSLSALSFLVYYSNYIREAQN